MGETPEEEIAEWLGRLEEEESLPDEITEFKRVLTDELMSVTGEPHTEAQIEALWNAKGVEVSFEEHGIRAVTVRYPWGAELRYGIQGVAGLWGWESVQAIRSAEEW